MSERQKRTGGRKRYVVVFLDANISVAAALYLADLRRYAHWVSFGSLELTFGEGKHKRAQYGKSSRRKIRWFFDQLGDKNYFDKEGIAPYKMKDDELLFYMGRLMEEIYPERFLYLFYTLDKKFLTQDRLKNHPLLYLFNDEFLTPELLKKHPHLSAVTPRGRLFYLRLEKPNRSGETAETAEAIRRDFIGRLDEFIL